jgi:hypothetical protein
MTSRLTNAIITLIRLISELNSARQIYMSVFAIKRCFQNKQKTNKIHTKFVVCPSKLSMYKVLEFNLQKNQKDKKIKLPKFCKRFFPDFSEMCFYIVFAFIFIFN